MHVVYSTYVCKITTAQKKCDLHVLFLAQTVIVCSTPSPNAASAFATKMISSSHLPPLWPPWPISTLLTHLHCKNPPSQNKCKQTTCTYTLANVRNSKLTLEPMLFTSPSKLTSWDLAFVFSFPSAPPMFILANWDGVKEQSRVARCCKLHLRGILPECVCHLCVSVCHCHKSTDETHLRHIERDQISSLSASMSRPANQLSFPNTNRTMMGVSCRLQNGKKILRSAIPTSKWDTSCSSKTSTRKCKVADSPTLSFRFSIRINAFNACWL